MRRRKKNYEPNAEQIRATCWKIQEGWSVKEEEKRRVAKTSDWTPPVVPTPSWYIDTEPPNDKEV